MPQPPEPQHQAAPRRRRVSKATPSLALELDAVPPAAAGASHPPKTAPEPVPVPAWVPAPQSGLPEPLPYEDALAELDALLARLDSGSLPLDTLLAEHQRGSELLALCRARLEALEQQLTVLDDAAARTLDPSNP